MLALTRKNGERLHLYPSEDIDPNMTVAELFKDGPLDIIIQDIKSNSAKVLIDAPEEIIILRDELLSE